MVVPLLNLEENGEVCNLECMEESVASREENSSHLTSPKWNARSLQSLERSFLEYLHDCLAP